MQGRSQVSVAGGSKVQAPNALALSHVAIGRAEDGCGRGSHLPLRGSGVYSEKIFKFISN